MMSEKDKPYSLSESATANMENVTEELKGELSELKQRWAAMPEEWQDSAVGTEVLVWLEKQQEVLDALDMFEQSPDLGL